MTELKPCPFCGGTVRVNPVTDEMYIRYYIRCTKCSARVEYSLTESFNEDKAVEVWNRRAENETD